MKIRAFQFLGAFMTFLLSIEAIYWPLIMKPGTVLSWWQIGWAAKIGYWVGAPVLLLIVNSPLTGSYQQIFAYLCTLAWSITIYFLIGRVYQWLYKEGK